MYAQSANYCSNCGASLQPGQSNCHNCGAPVSNPRYRRYNRNGSFSGRGNTHRATGSSRRRRGIAALLGIVAVGLVNKSRNGQRYVPHPGQASPQWLANDAFVSGPSRRSRGIAALLAIFVGSLGIHYFYCGRILAGGVTILLTVVTCGQWSWLMLTQGILMLCNMSNQEFEDKYIWTDKLFPLF